ncbi:uncharacterized protein LOC134537922 isoform X2 [Bacillus rossius redtenbacheri]|uniref:uncharacterized protein LOC134537922 isoform X2 n=1 Tax=Bacillus rossius redtenbacheri TaxID=93214 RepID=UPI002FDC8852
MAGHYIPNTRIAIDIWEELSERTVGLTSKWKRRIYTSSITARYLEQIIKVKPKFLKVLEVNKMYTIKHKGSQECFSVAVISAYHCPGSVMFLFNGKFGRILYTGHCRYKPSMLKHPALAQAAANQNLDVMFLDNTYAAPECKFPSDVECLKQVVELIRANPKRKILLALLDEDEAQALQCLVKVLKVKILISKEKYSTAQKLVEGDARLWFTDDPSQSSISAVQLSSVAAERNKDNSVVTILLTLQHKFGAGLELAGESDVHVIPYSTHSSYDELACFVSQLRPRQIVPIIAEASSWCSVIPKQLRNFCRRSSVVASLGKPSKRARPVDVVETVGSTVKRTRMRSPRKNLSLSKRVEDSARNCKSREDVVLEVESESSEVIEVVACSVSSESESRGDQVPLHKSPMLSSPVVTCVDEPGEPLQAVDHMLSGDSMFNQGVRVLEDDECSIQTTSPGVVERYDHKLFGTTLHQCLVDFEEKCSRQKGKVSHAVQTEIKNSCHHLDQFSNDEENFLLSVHILPLELKQKMGLRSCDCDSCMIINKEKHSKLFPRRTQLADEREDGESDELCSLCATKERDRGIDSVAGNSTAKHCHENKNSDGNIRGGNKLLFPLKCNESICNLINSADINVARVQPPVRFSSCLTENMNDVSCSVQKLNNNCWVTEYEVPISMCASVDDSVKLCMESILEETSGGHSSMCVKTNAEDSSRHLDTSSHYVYTARESTVKTKNQASELFQRGLSSQVENETVAKQRSFFKYLDLKQVHDIDCSEESQQYASNKFSKLRKRNSCCDTTSSIKNTCRCLIQRKKRKSYLATRKVSNKINVTGNCLAELCNKKSLTVSLVRLKPDQIRRYECPKKYSEVVHNSSEETFYTATDGLFQSCSNDETFYSTVSSSVPCSLLSKTNMPTEELNLEDIPLADYLLLGKCKINGYGKSLSTENSGRDPKENYTDCNNMAPKSVEPENTQIILKQISDEPVRSKENNVVDRVELCSLLKDQSGSCSDIHRSTFFGENISSSEKGVDVHHEKNLKISNEILKERRLPSHKTDLQTFCNSTERSYIICSDDGDDSSNDDLIKVHDKERENNCAKEMKAVETSHKGSSSENSNILLSSRETKLRQKRETNHTKSQTFGTFSTQRRSSVERCVSDTGLEVGRKRRLRRKSKKSYSAVQACTQRRSRKVYEIYDIKDSSEDDSVERRVSDAGSEVGRMRRLSAVQASTQSKRSCSKYRNEGGSKGEDEENHMKNTVADRSARRECYTRLDGKYSSSDDSIEVVEVKHRTDSASGSKAGKQNSPLSVSSSESDSSKADFFLLSPSRSTRLRRRIIDAISKKRNESEVSFYELS